MRHLSLGPKQRLTTYRKIAIASWENPRDPSVYAWIDLPVAEAEQFLKSYPAEVTPTLTHFVAKILAHCLEKRPELNHILRQGNLYRRERTDVYITTLLKGDGVFDLSGFTLQDAGKASLGELAQSSRDAVELLRKGGDPVSARTDAVVAQFPVWLLRIFMRVQSFFQYTLNISLRSFGIPDDRFGSFMISNFGPLGLENGLIPLSPYCRCPLMVGIGKTMPRAIVVDGQVIAAECVTISFTFDHRYADGAHGAQLMRLFQKIFLKPAQYASVFEREESSKAERS